VGRGCRKESWHEIPDLAISTEIDFHRVAVDPGAVPLVCAILSPSNPATDKVLKIVVRSALDDEPATGSSTADCRTGPIGSVHEPLR